MRNGEQMCNPTKHLPAVLFCLFQLICHWRSDRKKQIGYDLIHDMIWDIWYDTKQYDISANADLTETSCQHECVESNLHLTESEWQKQIRISQHTKVLGLGPWSLKTVSLSDYFQQSYFLYCENQLSLFCFCLIEEQLGEAAAPTPNVRTHSGYGELKMDGCMEILVHSVFVLAGDTIP